MILSGTRLIEDGLINFVNSHQHIHVLDAYILVFVLRDYKPHCLRPFPYLGLRNFLCINLPSNVGLP